MYVIKNQINGTVRIGEKIALYETVLIPRYFASCFDAIQAMNGGKK